MSDFPGGLADANEYLNRTVSVPTSTTIDATTGTITQTESSFTMRELICSLLAGNGLKLPNLQICLKANLGRLLNNAGVNWQGGLADLYTALNEAEQALEEFTAHTDIENVLNRMNAAVAEFAAVANMINFCGTPVQPRAIPNVLSDMFGSFTGEGKRLLDNLGTMLDSDIGGCIDSSGNFNPIFNGGILGQLQNNLSNLANLPQSTIDGFVSDLQAFKSDITNLINFENNFGATGATYATTDGSNFAPTTRIHTGVGTGIDPSTLTYNQAHGMANTLKSNYDSLKGYEVDGNGNNIFFYLLEPELIAKLDAESNPISDIDNSTPVYDYCGKVIGYTASSVQGDTRISEGSAASLSTQPGLTGLSTAGQVVHGAPSTTTNLAGTTTTATSSGSTGSSATTLNLSVSTASATTNPSLSYNNQTGVLTYTPPDLSQYTTTANLAPVALSNDFYSLNNIPSLTVPTVVSAFTNDSGYITLSNLSVTQAAASGTGALTYNSSTGVFTYTPPDLSSLGGGSSYNQSLNTTDDVTFDDITSTGTLTVNSLNVAGTGAVSLSAGNTLSLDATDRVQVTSQTPFRLATFTTAQRNAIAAPQNGDTIYNTDTHKFQGYANGAWVDLN